MTCGTSAANRIEAGHGSDSSMVSFQDTEAPQAISFRFDDRHVLYGKLRPYLNKVALPVADGKVLYGDRAAAAHAAPRPAVFGLLPALPKLWRRSPSEVPARECHEPTWTSRSGSRVALPPLERAAPRRRSSRPRRRHRPPAPRSPAEGHRVDPGDLHRHVRRPGYESERLADSATE